MNGKSPPQLLVPLVCCGVALMGFSGGQNVDAAHAAAGVDNRCTDAGKMLSAALEGQVQRTDVLLASAPAFPQVATNSVPPKLVRLTDTSYVWTTRWSGDRPSTDLVRRWLAARYSSISECLGGARSQRRIGELPGLANFHPIAKSPDGPLLVQATAPVLDKSGAYALVLYSTAVKQGFGGRTVFVLLKRSGSSWRKAAWRLLSVS